MKSKYFSKKIKIDLKLFSIFILAFLHGLSKMQIVSTSELLAQGISVLQYINYSLMFIYVCMSAYKIKELITFAILGALGVIILINSGEALFVIAILVIGTAKNRKYEDVCKVLFKGFLISFIITVILYLAGISGGGVYRRGAVSLGYSHPNVCGSVVQTLIFLFVSSRENKFSKSEWTMIIIGIFINTLFLDSRTTAVLLLLLPILRLIFKRVFEKNGQIYSVILCILPFILFGLIYYTTVEFGNNNFITVLDHLFNGRITLNNYNFYRLGVPLLGQKVVIYKGYILHNTIDCSYMVALLQCGIVATISILGAYSIVIKKIIKDKRYSLLAATVLMLFAGIMENSLLDIVAAFPLIYLIVPKNKCKYRGLDNIQSIKNVGGN